MLPQDTLKYIIRFLINAEVPDNAVGYTDNMEEINKFRIVIKPCGFFNADTFLTQKSMPTLPLQNLQGVPILFGQAETEMFGNTLLVKADIVASTFFMMTRYEELINNKRDEHGRFCGKYSVSGTNEFIDRPIIDEYGQLLRGWLRHSGMHIDEPPTQFSHIFLTHDADKLTQYRNPRGFAGGLFRALIKMSVKRLQDVVKAMTKGPEYDPLFTFSELLKLDKSVKNSQSIIFVKAGKKAVSEEDAPVYNLNRTDAKALLSLCKKEKCLVGLHSSYNSGENPNLISKEKERLENAFGTKIKLNRWHFLRCGHPENIKELEHSGITDDFSLGYADIAGFRLGTCRPMKWITPDTMELTDITIHPLSIMDCTLDEPKYMGLNENDAYNYCKHIIDTVRQHNGELVLLWHNSVVSRIDKSYHRNLYKKIIEYISL